MCKAAGLEAVAGGLGQGSVCKRIFACVVPQQLVSPLSVGGQHQTCCGAP